jgi:hypothetical protein
MGADAYLWTAEDNSPSGIAFPDPSGQIKISFKIPEKGGKGNDAWIRLIDVSQYHIVGGEVFQNERQRFRGAGNIFLSSQIPGNGRAGIGNVSLDIGQGMIHQGRLNKEDVIFSAHISGENDRSGKRMGVSVIHCNSEDAVSHDLYVKEYGQGKNIAIPPIIY